MMGKERKDYSGRETKKCFLSLNIKVIYCVIGKKRDLLVLSIFSLPMKNAH